MRPQAAAGPATAFPLYLDTRGSATRRRLAVTVPTTTSPHPSPVPKIHAYNFSPALSGDGSMASRGAVSESEPILRRGDIGVGSLKRESIQLCQTNIDLGFTNFTDTSY